MIIIIIS